MRQVKIQENIIQLEDGNKGKVAVFLYGGEGNPMVALDDAVKEYVGVEPSSQFIDINMDNPWVRVVITHINEMLQDDYDPSRHHATI